MDHFQLSLRLQVFLTYFCVFETCTLEHSAASPIFLTVSSPPEAAFLLAPEPQVTGKQAVFFRDVPRAACMLVQLGPSPATDHIGYEHVESKHAALWCL